MVEMLGMQTMKFMWTYKNIKTIKRKRTKSDLRVSECENTRPIAQARLCTKSGLAN